MTTEMSRAIGEAIRAARKELGLTQKSLAEQFGKKQNAVSAWEKGRAVPILKILTQLIDELGLDEARMMELYGKQRALARARRKGSR